MNCYFFILGRHPSLSTAELRQVLAREKIQPRPLVLAKDFIVTEAENALDLSRIVKKLGGTIKAGEILAEGRVSEDAIKSLKPLISADLVLRHFIKDDKKKNFIGLSLYLEKEEGFYKLKKSLARHFLEIKKTLKSDGLKLRIVSSREKTLSSVTVQKNRLLRQGGEVCIFVTHDKVFIGKTQVVQDFEDYSTRDYGRPALSMKIGMLPPKLARILVNLAGISEKETLLDPFCGVGTVLQEAILSGGLSIIGSDIDDQAIDKTRKNIAWLLNRYHLDPRTLKLKIFQSDVRNIGNVLAADSVDTVVTEPYLGPLISRGITEERVKKIIPEISSLYLDFFQAVKKILKTKAKIVMVWPVFRVGEARYCLPIMEKVEALGFKRLELLPREFSSQSPADSEDRNSLIYARPDQIVLREIIVFQNV